VIPPSAAVPTAYTLVCLHAHPDDEALLTGGLIARAAAEGHRVVLVVATRGEAGLTDASRGAGLGDRRARELDTAAAALGVHQVRWLGYADSGMAGARSGHVAAFADADVEQAAERLATILRSEHADVLTVYDAEGGYGHPDHVQVHRVGVRAAELAGTPVVLEATVDRDALRRVARLLGRVPLLSRRWAIPPLDRAYTPRAELTHEVDVRPYLAAKRAALAAHASQSGADDEVRSVAVFLRLPRPLFARVFGREWYSERGRPAGPPLRDDVFASVRRPAGQGA
jgi:LmbE family N-acetylglucosaminyl deacetylase